MSGPEAITDFLQAPAFAVVGASNDFNKYGAKVFACYLQHDKEVYPVNPNTQRIQGHRAYPSLVSLPKRVEAVSVITPPEVTDHVIDDAIEAEVKRLWLQPGAENPDAIQRAEAHGIKVIAYGPCILVVLGYRED